MRYLIDGHNLIGQLPDIALRDPDDEAKLVGMLHAFCLRQGERCTVVFDRGLPGGRSRLSTSQVEVVFAHGGTTADAILKERIRQVRDSGQWTVVSSDGEVQAEARRKGIVVLSSAEFRARLHAARPGSSEETKPEPSPRDTARWLEEFGVPSDED